MCISTQSWWGCKFDKHTYTNVKAYKAERDREREKHKLSFFSSAGVNYFASAMPFLSAVQQGLMGPEVQVLVQLNL